MGLSTYIKNLLARNKTKASSPEIYTANARIAAFTSTIKNTSFQANLLALKTAVEATKTGHGFAVITTEVRTLAQNCAEAAIEVQGLIKDTVGKFKVGTELDAESFATLQELVEGLQEVALFVTEITTACRKQSLSIGQVSTAATQMDGIIQQYTSLIEAATTASHSMLARAGNLIEITSFSKSDSGKSINQTREEPSAISAKVVEFQEYKRRQANETKANRCQQQ